MSLVRSFIAIITLAAMALVAGEAFTFAQTSTDTANEQQNVADERRQIKEAPAQLLLNLKSNRFSVRQRAMFDIIASPGSTIDLIENEIGLGDADFRARALKILQHLAINDDSQSQAAHAAIRRISFGADPLLARKARLCSFNILMVRQHAAAKRLERLNAKIVYTKAVDGADFPMADRLTIDDTWRGSADDLKDVAELFGLSSATLNHEQIDDSFAALLLKAYTLSHVKFKKCPISRETIARLSQSPLSKLEILYCDIGPECFDSLREFRQLNSLSLIGTRINPDLSELLEQRLNAKIELRNGAFLGIRYSPVNVKCQITWLVEGSGAEKAGFQVGDEIIEFDSVPILEHADLTNLLRKQKAGRVAQAKVLRGEEVVTISVAMGEWD
ncbi:MAG: PDZ domain-containing protein [Mariniblastus sp.]